MKNLKVLDVKTKRLDLKFEFDTWGSPRNYDKLITNAVRLIALWSLIYAVVHWVATWQWWVVMPIAICFVGVTDIKYFRLKRTRIELKFW